MGHTKKPLFYTMSSKNHSVKVISKDYAQDIYHDKHTEGQVIIRGNTAYQVGPRGNWIKLGPKEKANV